jgi:[ribosomal protein S5]-alanine N-acetyltransferase
VVNVSIEPRLPAHAEALFAVLSDPLLYEFVDEVHRPASVAALRERLERNAGGKSPDGSEDWLGWVIRDDGGEIVGSATATIHSNREADIAYSVASRHWGKGYARSAVTELLARLVSENGVTVFCIVAERLNVRSVRLAERLGFVEVSSASEAATRHALTSSEVEWHLLWLSSQRQRA